MNKIWLTTLCCIMAVACDNNNTTQNTDAGTDSGSDTGSDTRRDTRPMLGTVEARQAAVDALNTQICTCDMGTATSVEACVENGRAPAFTEMCDTANLAEGGIDTIKAFFDCRTRLLNELAACLADADCNQTASNACNQTFQDEGETCQEELASQEEINTYLSRNAQCLAGSTGTCPEGAVSSSTGNMVFSGTTYGKGADLVTETVAPGADAGAADAGADAGAGPGPSTLCAPVQSGMTTFVPGGLGPDVVHQWTAPSSGVFLVTAFADFDAVLYVRSSCSSSTNIACDEESPFDTANDSGQATVALNATMGTTYFLVIDGVTDQDAGTYQVAILPTQCPSMPMPTTVTGNSAYTGTVAAMAPEAERCLLTGTNNNVHVWTPATTGSYVVTTTGSAADTVLSVRTNCNEGDLFCNDDVAMGTLSSRIQVNAFAGTPYIFNVQGKTTGAYQVNINASACPENNTVPASPTGASVFSGTTVGAGNDSAPGAGCTTFQSNNDVSYAWTAPSTGRFVIDTAGSATDTLLYVRQGCSTFTDLVCHDDVADMNLTSRVVLDAVMGTQYIIYVDSFNSMTAEGGAFVVNINPM